MCEISCYGINIIFCAQHIERFSMFSEFSILLEQTYFTSVCDIACCAGSLFQLSCLMRNRYRHWSIFWNPTHHAYNPTHPITIASIVTQFDPTYTQSIWIVNVDNVRLFINRWTYYVCTSAKSCSCLRQGHTFIILLSYNSVPLRRKANGVI